MSIFLWGQNNGGAVEVFPLSVVMRFFGDTVLAERLLTMLLGAVAAYLGGRIAARLMGGPAGLVAGAVLWLWPPYFVVWSTMEYLYYTPVVVLGLAAIWWAIKTWDRPPQGITLPTLVGIAAGVGWWSSPNIAVFAVPVALALLKPRPYRLRRNCMAVVGFVAGAGPWLVFNLLHGFASLDAGILDTHASYGTRLSGVFQAGIPISVGLKNPSGSWLGPWAHDLYCVLLAAFVLAAIWWLRRWRLGQAPAPIDLAGCFAYPFILAASPVVGTAKEVIPRYFFFLWPYLALGTARVIGCLVGVAMSREERRHRVQRHHRSSVLAVSAVAAACCLALCALALEKFAQLPRASDVPPAFTSQQGDMNVVAADLERHHVHDLFAGYWLAYRLDQASVYRVIATPALPATARYGPWEQAVRRSPNPAWMFVPRSIKAATFQQWLVAAHIATTSFHAGGYLVFVPDSKVLPEQVPAPALINPTEGV